MARGGKGVARGGKGFKCCKCTRVESNFLITENVARGGKGVARGARVSSVASVHV